MKLKSTLSLFVLLVLALKPAAQVAVDRVVIANGGTYSNPDDFVTLDAYDPQTGITYELATIFTHSVQGLLVHEGNAFVAAQDSLAKINISNGEVEAAIALTGVNKFAVWQDMLLVSRQYPVTSDFVQIFGISDLSFVKSFPQISDESWEITVAGDTAYVSVAGGWAATTGKLAVIDLPNLSFVRETDLGENAVGIGPSYKYGDQLVFICKTPYLGTSGTIITYDINTTEKVMHTIQHAIGEGAGMYDNLLYLKVGDNVGVFNLTTGSLENACLIENPFDNLEITGMALDTVNQQIYVNYSFWTPPDGTGKIYDLTGTETGEYEVGVSAEEVAMSYVNATGFDEPAANGTEITVYPNPCVDYLNIQGDYFKGEIIVTNLHGNVIIQMPVSNGTVAGLDVSAFPHGIYYLVFLKGNKVTDRKKFIIIQ